MLCLIPQTHDHLCTLLLCPRPGGPEYEQEAANSSKVYGASWHMVMGQAESAPGMPDPESPAATASQDGKDPGER